MRAPSTRHLKGLRPGRYITAMLPVRWRRRLSPVNALCLFLVCFILVTAYLHGLIEVDSNRLVINIAASSNTVGSDGDHAAAPGRSRSNDDSDSSIVNAAGSRRRGQADDENIYANAEHDMIRKRPPKITKKATTTSDEYDYLRHDKNITNLFLILERNRPIILSTLSKLEIDDLLRLKRDMLVAANLNGDANDDGSNEESPPAPAAPPPPPVDIVTNMFTINETRQREAMVADAQAEAAFRPITRELMIKFLKLEKFQLQKMKTVRTVRNLLDEFITQNDLNREELPEIWHKYFVNINELQLYNDSQVLNQVLQRMSTIPVNSCYEKEKGTQIKLLLSLEDGTDVLVKPMKVPRDYETPPDHFYFVDFERHHAEIAAFHVDKLLGFNRVPPTVGRVFNMTTDLWEKAEEELGKTFFYSPAGNVCFTGHCSYYCDTTHAICGRPRDRMEGSVQLMLPSKPIVKWQVFNHPYRRTYTKRKKALWEVDDTYCEVKLLQDVKYSSKLILDLMDMSIFDFLTGNMDRHHYEKMTSLGNDTFLLHLDNGRSFGKAHHDEMSILAPLRQCCFMRFSTFERLRHLYANKFSRVLDESLRVDPLYPILTKSHLKAVDRRLVLIFYQLIECLRRYKPFEVIVDDGY